MRRFTISQFDRLSQKNWVGQEDTMPTPFPGKWPTRLAWHVQTATRDESYLGKPTCQAAQRFTALAGRATGNCYIVEFDRTHIPIYLWSPWRSTQTHPVLFTAYHYWQGVGAFAAHLAVPSYHCRLRGLTIYSPYRALSGERKAMWAAYMQMATKFPLKPAVGGEESI